MCVCVRERGVLNNVTCTFSEVNSCSLFHLRSLQQHWSSLLLHLSPLSCLLQKWMKVPVLCLDLTPQPCLNVRYADRVVFRGAVEFEWDVPTTSLSLSKGLPNII